MKKKECTSCKELKPLNCFYKQKRGLLGKTSTCKACRCEYQRLYNDRNTEKRRETQAIYLKNNPEKQREKSARFRKNNPDYWREYYAKNRAKRLEANKKCRDKKKAAHGNETTRRDDAGRACSGVQ